MRDSPYREAPWNAVESYHSVKAAAAHPDLRRYALQYRASLEPVDRDWLKKRLSAMMLAFGHERDPDRVSAWLAETGRLLIDLPGDILATAIDEAIKRSERGFIPAVGQIRAIADPLVADRRREVDRLEAMVAIEDRGALPKRPQVDPAGFDPAERCTPDQAAAILREFGMSLSVAPAARRHEGPSRNPTADDYRQMMGEAAGQADRQGKQRNPEDDIDAGWPR